MTPHYADDAVTLYHGDCLDVLRELPDGSVDSCVTDPPYLLGFMGREWDTRAAHQHLDWHRAWADEALRVLKPGGHLLAFGGTRTWHRLACAIEDAGFEVRDSIAWLYGSGFPKSRNLGGAYAGWGTALKPAFEPVVVARKPLAGTVAANVLEHGTGALNIDGCRVEMCDVDRAATTRDGDYGASVTSEGWGNFGRVMRSPISSAGRWPANVTLDESQAAALDEQSGTQRARGNTSVTKTGQTAWFTTPGTDDGTVNPGDAGGASRFFYVAKAPTAERPRDGQTAHPTVKPLDLMRWLVRLVTPPGGLVLDPFLGSGTTAEACIIEGFRCIGIEREADYLPLILARITKPIEPVLDFGAAS